MMFGTDYPFVESEGGHLDALDIPDAEKSAMMGTNAARVFGLG